MATAVVAVAQLPINGGLPAACAIKYLQKTPRNWRPVVETGRARHGDALVARASRAVVYITPATGSWQLAAGCWLLAGAIAAVGVLARAAIASPSGSRRRLGKGSAQH